MQDQFKFCLFFVFLQPRKQKSTDVLVFVKHLFVISKTVNLNIKNRYYTLLLWPVFLNISKLKAINLSYAAFFIWITSDCSRKEHKVPTVLAGGTSLNNFFKVSNCKWIYHTRNICLLISCILLTLFNAPVKLLNSFDYRSLKDVIIYSSFSSNCRCY